jgi:glutathione S-transferase
MAARYELIGSAVSPFVRKVRAVMVLKNVAYDLTEISVFDPPDWFDSVSPLRRIPVLRDRERGGATLNDSSVIVAYLEAAHPEHLVYPTDPWERARALWIEEYMDTEFAFRMGMGLFRTRYVYPKMGRPTDEALVQKTLTEHAPKFYRYLEAEIAGKDWFVGQSLSIADIAVGTQFVNMRLASEAPDPALYPHLSAYVAKMLVHPVFAE